MSDIVERLLAEGRHFRGNPDCVGPAVTLLVERAADTITALRAENERLTAALEEVRVLVFGANNSDLRYPKARAALKEDRT
jgi:hypothetical protein